MLAMNNAIRQPPLLRLLAEAWKNMKGMLPLLLAATITIGNSGALSHADVPKSISEWVRREFPGAVASYSRSITFRNLGLTGLLVKAQDLDGVPLSLVFDEEGNLVSDDLDTLRQLEAERRFELMGALSDSLYAATIAMDDATRLPVAIWLRTFEPGYDRAEAAADPTVLQFYESLASESRDKAQRGLLDGWHEIDVTPRFEPDMPVAYAELKREEIFSLMDNDYVSGMYLLDGMRSGGTNYVDSVRANAYAYDGSGQSICVIEVDSVRFPNTLSITDSRCQTTTTDQHARWVMGILRSGVSPFGVATSSSGLANHRNCSSVGTLGFDGPATKWCVDKGSRVWNCSFYSFGRGIEWTDDFFGLLYDYRAIRPPYPVITVIAGNVNGQQGPRCPTGLCAVNQEVEYFNNGITVGASDDCDTTSRSDDTMWCWSAGINIPTLGSDEYEIERPHLVAPGRDITAENFTASGTSAAAPQVSGAAAQLLEHDSLLVGWPEAVRAILISSALEDVDVGRLSLTDSLDDRDGAGELDIGTAHQIAGQKKNGANTPSANGYDFGTVFSTSTPVGAYYSETYAAQLATAFLSRLRVTLTWNQDPTCSSPDLSTWSCTSAGDPYPAADFDLHVFRRSTGDLVAVSNTFYNNYEFVDIQIVPGEIYDLKFRVWHWRSTSTHYGIAWKVYYGVP